MAEAFGIFAGAAGLAGLFTPCVECFEYVQFGRNFGQDCERSLGSEAGRRWTCYVSCITTMATDNGRAPGHTVDHLKTIQVPSFPLREKPEYCWAHERMPTGRIERVSKSIYVARPYYICRICDNAAPFLAGYGIHTRISSMPGTPKSRRFLLKLVECGSEKAKS